MPLIFANVQKDSEYSKFACLAVPFCSNGKKSKKNFGTKK